MEQIRAAAKIGSTTSVEGSLYEAERLISKWDNLHVVGLKGKKLPLLSYQCKLNHIHQVKEEIVAKILCKILKESKDIIISDHRPMIPRTFIPSQVDNQGLKFKLVSNTLSCEWTG